MNKPKIFVSSTCYDLEEVRLGISEFIDELGYTSILSNLDDFPVNPNKEAIENCTDTVGKEADIFILIIGNRYGYITESGFSVTNLEYIEAKRKNIPIYIFIRKQTMNYFNAWKNNKSIVLDNIVDSNKVFNFIETVRERDNSWCFEFEQLASIKAILKTQFANLFYDALEHRKIVAKNGSPKYWSEISPEAIDILLKRDLLFEMKFFIQVMTDEFLKIETLYSEYENDLWFRSSKAINDFNELFPWIKQQMKTLSALPENSDKLINKMFKKYYGEIESDFEGLVFVAKTVAKQLKEIIEWSLEIKSTFVYDERIVPLVEKLSEITKEFIEDMWGMPQSMKNEIDEGIEKYNRGEKIESIDIKREIRVDDEKVQSLINEFKQLLLVLNN